MDPSLIAYVFNSSFANLDAWVRFGRVPPRAPPLALVASPNRLPPDQAFETDELGNAKGGVRTPYVDVPTARWVGAKSGPFVCLFHGYKFPFNTAQLKSLYSTHQEYVAKVRASVTDLVNAHWLTRQDGERIITAASAPPVP